MGAVQPNGPTLTAVHVRQGLGAACTEMGICVRGAERDELVGRPPADADELAERLLVIQGFRPAAAPRAIRARLDAVLERAFDHTALLSGINPALLGQTLG
jgi:hypothetical protein